MSRPVYFRQKGIWYKVEGECNQCGLCCIKPSNIKCGNLSENNKCLIQSNKPIGCANFPSGTPDQYFDELKDIMLNKCKLKITKVEDV